MAGAGLAEAGPVIGEAGSAMLAPADRTGIPPGPVTTTPTDFRYRDLLFRTYNKRLVSQPDSVRVVGATAHVVQAVNDAVRNGKRVAVRSGGHCLDGLVDNADAEVIIDFVEMRAITFDPARNAFAIEPGATMGEVYRTLCLGWGVTLPGGICPAVGAGGHLIGNGFGALSRQHGLVADHLYAVEVVVVGSDGQARAVVATREPSDPNRDLWWAHTGSGGGNFGIVTRFWLRSPNTASTNPSDLLPKVPGALMIGRAVWSWADLTEDSFVRLARNFGTWMEQNSAPNAPGTALYGALSAPRREHGQVLVAGQVDPTVAGNEQLLDSYLAAMTRDLTPQPQIIKSGRLPWLTSTVNVPDSAVAAGVVGPPRLKANVAHLKMRLTDAQVARAYDHLTRTDYHNPASGITLHAYGGQINALSTTATATPHRHSVMMLAVAATWDVPADDAQHLAWARECYRDLFTETGGVPVPNDAHDGCHVNWPNLDLLSPEWNRSAMSAQELFHTSNYARLREIKATWDPHDIFRHPLSIALP
ncbi:FAD-binding oxidoreductase [Nonomuraea lactucae]|uniref:FAD-binding oxidoreductase n=1 Tax=Nonomuraea lactucae TaxID=2249762 RepID=UPI0019627A15|nr:FAD-binding oxidoreductase [Nonomuraea lactucae]